MTGWFLYESFRFPLHDFANYYFAGYFFRTGAFDPSIYFPGSFNARILQTGHTGIFVSLAPNPPLTGPLFAALSLLPPLESKLLFNAASLAFLLTALRRYLKAEGLSSGWIGFLPFAFILPFRNNLMFGQVYLLLMGLILEGFLCYRNKKWWKAGLMWGTAIMLKLSPVLVLLVPLAHGEWKLIRWTGLSIALIEALSVMLTGFDLNVFYLTEVLPMASAGEISDFVVPVYQSADMLFKSLFVEDPAYNPEPLIPLPGGPAVLLAFFNAAVLSTSWQILERSSRQLALGSVLLASLLLTPMGSTYSLILLIPLMLSISRKIDRNTVRQVVLLLAAVNMPVHWITELPLPLNFLRLLLLLAVLLSIATPGEVSPRIFASILFPLLIFGFLRFESKEADESFYLVPEERATLVTGYRESEGKLEYTILSPDGPMNRKTEMIVNSLDTAGLEIRDNQILYSGRQITFGQDHKAQPAILDKRLLVYLSDRNKGIGFYSLRGLNLR